MQYFSLLLSFTGNGIHNKQKYCAALMAMVYITNRNIVQHYHTLNLEIQQQQMLR